MTEKDWEGEEEGGQDELGQDRKENNLWGLNNSNMVLVYMILRRDLIMI